MEFRDAVKYLRNELGFTQIDLANALHVTPLTIGRWENGRNLPNRAFTTAIMDLAREKGVTKHCLELLERSITNAAKEKLSLTGDVLFSVEHASLRQLIDDASFPIYVCDMETDELLYLNQKACAMVGTDESVIGKKCYECLMHRDAPCEFCHKNELVEDRFICYEALRAYDNTAYKVQGKLIKWNGREAHVRYITEADSGDQLKSIVENMNGGVSVVSYGNDGSIRLAYANERYYALFGYTKEQFLSELKDAHDTLHPDDYAFVGKTISQVKSTGKPVTFRYRIIKRDGSAAFIRCSSSMSAIPGLGDRVLISVLTDITASVEAEQQTLVLGHRLDSIMKNISNAVTAATLRDDGTVDFLFSNELFYEMLGYTREQYQKEVPDPFQLVYPADADAIHSAVAKTCHVGETKKLQYRVVCRDGQIKWLRARISVLSFPDEEKPVQLTVYSDVTDMVEANERLASQRDQISEMVNAAPSGIAVIEVDPNDIEGSQKTTYYNDRFFSFSGYSREEYDALLKENQMHSAFDEDLAALRAFTAKICAGDIGNSADITVRCHTKNGGFRWLLLTAQLVEKYANRCIISLSQVDVTERKKAIEKIHIGEEMFRIAAETDKRAIIIYDVKANVCRVESRNLFCAKYGAEIENIPESLIELGIAQTDSIVELVSLFDRIRSGEERVSVSLQLRTGTAEYHWFECNAAVVFDEQGKPDHAVLVFHNITEQRVKEAVFKKWRQSIETRPPESYTLFRCNLSRDASLDERDGQLLGIQFTDKAMAFNERTKEYATQYVYPDDQEAYIALLDSDSLLAMYYRGKHGASLEYREMAANGEVCWRLLTVELVEYLNSSDVQAFLMYEDINERKLSELKEKEMAETDPLTGVLNRAAFAGKIDALIAREAGAQHALIMLDMDGFKRLNDTFGHAAGDQALLDVTAVLRALTREGDFIGRLGGDEFLIWLRGIPYDAVISKMAQQMCEQVRKVFSSEVQISASVGISVYPRDGHSFDELYHKADKALYSVKQAGKDNYAFFSQGTAKSAQGTTDEPKTAPRVVAKAKRRMLIVDDNETNRLMLANVFKDEYQIELAKNGADAMVQLRHFSTAISIVLLDLIMPGMDGFEVLKKMQANVDLTTIPVIVVSGDQDHKTLLRAIESGAADYMTKPVDPEFIRIRVRSAVSKAENERLRAQNSYLQLQRDEKLKFLTVLESTGTVVVEYDWRNHVFIYDHSISKYIAGNYDNRSLWTVFLSDMVAESADVKALQEMLLMLANDREKSHASRLVQLKSPRNGKHWFRMNVYKQVDAFGLAEKMIITFNDVHEDVLANDKLLYQATRDELTGLYNRAGFIEKAAELIRKHEAGYYVMTCIDIEKFKVINDQYGMERGDKVLKKLAVALTQLFEPDGGICCRVNADNFAVLFPQKLIGTPKFEQAHRDMERLTGAALPIKFAIGRCSIDDKTLNVSAIYDRACLAKDTVKGRFDRSIATYDESMRTALLRQQEIIGQMNHALENGEFEVWLQPQFNHSSGILCGAEALVRWRHPKEGIISPAEFIPIFERNGFVYEVDKYVWEQVCILLRKWLDQGLKPVPVSVNISRYDVFRDDLLDVITGLVKKHNLPLDLLRLEITESAFTESTDQIISVVNQFVALGFIVEIDDFGSGYSSLNTLKDVPAQVIKMDMRFLENDTNAQRGGSIIESVVRMARWLGMTVIAEGVETIEQADFLRSIGCDYIQGYLYSRPTQVLEYEKLFENEAVESRFDSLHVVEAWNNNAFWNPKSMESLIFNSYVGGACIFEYHNGTTEILRINNDFRKELRGLIADGERLTKADFTDLLDSRNDTLLLETVQKAAKEKEQASCELLISRGGQTEYVRITIRLIASTADRMLFYAVILNMTEQREAERKQIESAQQLAIIMGNINGGVAAQNISEDGRCEVIFANDRYFEIFGYPGDQARKESLNVMSLILPEDFPLVMDQIRKLKKDRIPVAIDYRCKRLDGRIVYLRENCALMQMDGYGDEVVTSVVSDITEQRELDDKFKAVVENINGGVSATYLRAGKPEYVIVNDRYYDIIGYTKEQFEAEVSNVFELVHPDDRERIERQFREAALQQGQYTMEYRFIRRDGFVRHILCNTNVIRLFGVDEPVQLAVSNDITELRESQQKEYDLSQQLQAIMANVHGGVTATVYHDKNNVEMIFANDGFYELYGFTKEQMSKEVGNILDLILPEDRDKTMEAVAHVVAARVGATYEYRCRKRDGSIMWTQVTNSVISMSGVGDTVLLSLATDITALRESQQKITEAADKLQTVLNHAGNGMTAIALYDDKPEFLFANRKYYEIVGYTEEAYAQNTAYDMFAIIHPDDRDAVHAKVTGITEKDGSVCLDYRVIRADGSVVWIRATVSITAMTGVDAPVQIALFCDITEEVKANEQLRFLNKSAHDILAQPDCEQALHDTLRELMNYFGACRGYVVELNHEKNVSYNTYEVCADGASSEQAHLQGIPFGPDDFWFASLMRHEYFTIEDVDLLSADETALRQMLKAQGIRSIIIAGLWKEGRLIGFVGVDNPTQATDQIDRLTALSDYIAILLTRRDFAAILRKTEGDLLDNLPNGAALYEFDGETMSAIHINKRYWQLVEREPVNYYRTSVLGVIHPDDLPLTNQEIAAAIRQQRDVSVNLRIRCGQTAFKPFHVAATIAPKADGKYLFYTSYTPIAEEAMSVQEMIPIALSTVMSASSNISYVKDKNMRYICCSRSLVELLGLGSEREVIGKSAHELFAPEYADKFDADDRAIMASGKPEIDAKEYIPTLHHEVRLMQTSKYPLLDAFGEVIGVYCLSIDITSQREKESQLELLTSSIPGGLAAYLLTDKGPRILFFNDGFYAFSGCTREEYAKAAEESAFAFVFDEDKPIVEAVVKDFMAHKVDGRTGECVFRCHTKSGEYRWLSMKTVLSQIGRERFVINAVLLDISEQKEVENRQKELLDHLPCGAALYRFDGKNISAVHINKQYERMTGRRSNSANTSQAPMDFVHPDDRPVVMAEIADAIKNHREAACDIRILYSKNTYRTFRVHAHITQQADGAYSLYATYSEITERELTFRETVPFIFSAIMDSSADLAFAKDRNFRYLCCSKSFADFLGLGSEENVIGKTDYELFSKEIADRFREDDSRLIATGKPMIDLVEPIPTPDGRLNYIRMSKHILCTAAGEVIGLYGSGRDITESREAYEQLKLMTNSIPGGLATFACSPKGIRLTYCNDGFCKLFDIPRESYDSVSFGNPIHYVVEADRPILTEQYHAMMSGGTPIDCIYRIQAKDGTRRWIHHRALVSDRHNDVVFVNAALFDITAQQDEKEQLALHEEEYRLAAEHSGRIICRYNIADRSVTITTEAAKRLGLPKRLEDVPYGRVKQGFVSSDTADAYIAFYEAIIHGEKEKTAVFQKLLPTGWRWFSAHAATIFADNGTPVSAIVSYEDVTQEQEKEAAFSKWNQALQNRKDETYTLFRSNLNKSASLDTREGALLAHWVGDAAAKSFNERTLDFASKWVAAEDRDIYIRFVNSDAMLAGYHKGKRADALDFRAVMPSGEIHWLRLSVELVGVPHSTDVEAYLMYENIDEQKQTELAMKQMAETDPLTGLLNRKTFSESVNALIQKLGPRAQHAFFMLDIDGFKLLNDTFGHAAGDEALIEVSRKLQALLRHGDLLGRLGGDEFVMFLENIPGKESIEKKARQLCASLYKSYSAEVSTSVSIGVSLYPQDGSDCHSLYENADTALYAAKESGRNTFSFYHSAMSARGTATEKERGERAEKPAKTQVKRRMLIVDDNALDRKVLAHLFEKDFIVDFALDGASALSRMRYYGSALSIVLLDLFMQGMTGLDVLEKARKSPEMQNIPIIVVSADNDRETSLRAIRAGATDFIIKPVEPELIHLRVDAAISRAENERLRAQNSHLQFLGDTTERYQTALSQLGMAVVELDWIHGSFTYDSSISQLLKGSYDGRSLWRILMSDMVADTKDVQKLQEFIHDLADDRSRHSDSMKIQLRAPSNARHWFSIYVTKLVNDAGLTQKLVLTFQDTDAGEKSSGTSPALREY